MNINLVIFGRIVSIIGSFLLFIAGLIFLKVELGAARRQRSIVV
ncbi:hypothetical protein [Halalkalibacter nanhaiisediminis]|nr:hypothetical protein [Halalkalibacter nanhaiisediminis]